MKDISRRKSWWVGWVRYSYVHPVDRKPHQSTRATEYEFDTAGQAQRAAEALAWSMAKPTKYNPQGLTIVEIGASKVE